MYRYVGPVPRTSWLKNLRYYNNILLRPLMPESTTQQVTAKSSQLLDILKITQGDILKLAEQDYNDLSIMVSRLPAQDASLFKELSDNLLNANFYEMNTRLVNILLEVIHKRNDTNLLLRVVNQFSGALTTALDSKIKRKLYEIWASSSSFTLQQELIGKFASPNNDITFNILVQTHILLGSPEKSLEIVFSGLESARKLDRYSIELLVYHLMDAGAIQSVYNLLMAVHDAEKSPYMDAFLPLSNQQFGKLLSLAISQDEYKMSRRLFNRYCYFQKLHFVDQGSLHSFARAAVRHQDLKQLIRILRLLKYTDRTSYDSQVETECAINLLECKWSKATFDEAQRNQLSADFQALGVLQDLAAADFPLLVQTIRQHYPLSESGLIASDVRATLLGEGESGNGARLLNNVFLLALSEAGKPEMIFSIITEMNDDVHMAKIMDAEAIFYLIRAYYKSDVPLTEKSAAFIVGVILNQKRYQLPSKAYRMVFKILGSKYSGDKSILKPLISKCEQQNISYESLLTTSSQFHKNIV